MTVSKPEKTSKNREKLSWMIFLSTAVFAAALFFYLNNIEPHYFVDEIFHIPQTISFCKKQFVWNPKITTLPGLYLLTSFLLAPFDLCTTIWIRSTSLIATFVNLYLITKITRLLDPNPVDKWWIQLASSYNIAFCPTLFFFFFLYYTDIFSITMVLSMYLMHLQERYNTAALFGLFAMLVRQTNVIWVFFLAATYCLDKLHAKSKHLFPTKPRTENETLNYSRRVISFTILESRQNPVGFCKFVIGVCGDIWAYVTCGLLFAAFVVWNKSIVVGDHSSHKPTVHLLQIFYFSVFTFAFAWPYMLPHWKDSLKSFRKHWTSATLGLVFLAAVVRWNTLVHRFVLADNRHYVFYIWNRFLKYEAFRYLLVPIYAFTCFSFSKCMGHMKPSMRIAYVFCTSIVLVPQLLLEPRYFLIPYVIFRLHLKRPKNWQIVMESAVMLVVNVLQFYIFVRKTFHWEDMQHPQRIGW